MSSVGAEFPKEQARCRDLLGIYKTLGINGAFGASMIEQVLERADEAMASGDVIAVLRSYQEMKECK